MRFVSVCSGIEAASVAWEPLGWSAVAFAEIDPFPSAVLAHRFPSVPNLGDFTTIRELDEPIDLLMGGTPCQSFSVAGRRAGLDDPRGVLAFEYLALAGRLRPRWLVFENVPGLLSSNGGRDFGAFLGALGELGYGWAYRVLDAQFFGVPQRRRRVFVVGCLGDWRRAAAVLLERASLRGDPTPRREAGERVAGTLTGGAAGGRSHGKLNGSDRMPMVAGTLGRSHGNVRADEAWTNRLVSSDCSPSLRAQAQSSHREDSEAYVVTHTLRGEGFDASEDGTGTPLVPIAFDAQQVTSHENRSRCEPGAPAPTLSRTPERVSLAFQTRGSNIGVGEISGTLGTNAECASGGAPMTLLSAAVRRLTPREAERLQGFPDDWTLVPYRDRPASDGPRYRAIGNSMAVPVVRWIGERIAMVESLEPAHA